MRQFTSLMRGQAISLLIAGTGILILKLLIILLLTLTIGIFASLLSSTTPSSNHPVLMALFNYILLSSYLIKGHIKGTTTTTTMITTSTHTNTATTRLYQEAM